MSRRFLQRVLPAPQTLKDRWFLKPFGERLADPHLWALHRRGVTSAFGVGLAVCFVPLPVHLVLASVIAVTWRLNVPVACGTTFLLNPFTAVPAYYFAYRVGAALLHSPPHHFRFVPTFGWFRHALAPIWQPFFAGCVVCAILAGILGWAVFEMIWRWRVTSRYRNRHVLPATAAR